jgi:hypothetical protein
MITQSGLATSHWYLKMSSELVVKSVGFDIAEHVSLG